MILHNIIFPHKHPYITPQVTFEEIEGDDMICVSGEVETDDYETDDEEGGNSKAKQNFIFECDEDIY